MEVSASASVGCPRPLITEGKKSHGSAIIYRSIQCKRFSGFQPTPVEHSIPTAIVAITTITKLGQPSIGSKSCI